MKVFVSYTSSDREWAHWIGWQLKNAGHEPFVHDWEIGAGENIAGWMEDRFKQADRLIGVFSDAYCKAAFSQSEQLAAYWRDPRGRTGFLVPVEVRKVTEWPGLVAPLKRLSLVGLDEGGAAQELLTFLEPPHGPTEKPAFPGAGSIASKSSTSFTEGSESLGSSPPSFPVSLPTKNETPDVALVEAHVPYPNIAIRCIDDHEPRLQIFGRDDERETIVTSVLNGQLALVAGGPGIGKTALATAAFYDPRVVVRFGRRRVFSSLEAATEPRAILAKLVETLGLPPTGDEASLLRIIERSAAEEPIAAIIDNAETVLDTDSSESQRLLNLVGQIKGLSPVITIRGVSLPIPGAVQIPDLPKLAPDAARDAFLAIGGASFASDPDLLHLLEALDGHALSIRLVAAQAIGLPSLKGLRESWDEAHAEILRISGQRESRLTSVHASLALSLNSRRMTSTPMARRLLAVLAYLPGGLAESDVRSLLGERGALTKARANEAVMCLHQLRLVERRPDLRLRMLTPLRECVKTDVSLSRADQDRLIERYLTLATRAGAIGSGEWEKYGENIEIEADNLDAICDLAITKDISHRHCESGLMGLAEFHNSSGRGSVSSLAHAIERLRSRPPTSLLANCITSLAKIARMRSDGSARTHYEEAMRLWRRIGDQAAEATCLWSLGEIARLLSDEETSRARYEAALLLYRRLKDLQGEAYCIRSLGDIERRCYDYQLGRARYKEALTLFRRIGHMRGEADSIQGLASDAYDRSDHDAAQPLFEEALRVYRHIGSVSGQATCVRGLAGIATRRQEHATARTHYEEALVFTRRIGGVLGEAHCIWGSGRIAYFCQDNETARVHFGNALALYGRIGYLEGQAACILSLGHIARVRSDHETARARYAEAMILNKRIGNVHGEAEILVRQGMMMRRGASDGLLDIETGFARYFGVADAADRALDGWRALHRALTCTNSTETEHFEQARSVWANLGRLDLVYEWIDHL